MHSQASALCPSWRVEFCGVGCHLLGSHCILGLARTCIDVCGLQTVLLLIIVSWNFYWTPMPYVTHNNDICLSQLVCTHTVYFLPPHFPKIPLPSPPSPSPCLLPSLFPLVLKVFCIAGFSYKKIMIHLSPPV